MASSSKNKVFTMDEVKQHNKREDLWIIIHGKVYDVTKFLNEHPGGDDVLLEVAGTDSTVAFDEVGHSNAAIESLDNYYVGDVEAPKKDAKQPPRCLLTMAAVLSIAAGAALIFKGFKMSRQ